MRDLTLITYLGDNATTPAGAIAAGLTARHGIPVAACRSDSPAEISEAVSAGQAHLVWMCGFVTVQAIDEGRLPVDIVAAPIFPGQDGPTYRSVIIARRDAGASSLDDLAGARLAVNERHSWSGYHALRIHLTDTGRGGPFFRSIEETGSHAVSVEAVLTGAADTAAVDATIWTDMVACDDGLRALAVIDRTRAWPAPPFSVSRSLDPAIREALRTALPSLHPQGLDGIRSARDAEYDPIRRAVAQAGLVDLAAEVPW